MPANLPVCPYATTRLPLDWFSWNLKFEDFTETYKKTEVWLKSDKE